MEFRLTAVIAEHGFSRDAAEACFEALIALYPHSGPVVAQNIATGHLRIVVAVDATDPWAASTFGARIVTESLTHANLQQTPVLDLSVTAIDLDDPAEHTNRMAPA